MKNMLTQEEIDLIAKDFEKDWKIREQKSISFYHSERFQDVFSQLNSELENQKTVSENHYAKGFLFGNVSNDEFIEIFSVLFEKSISGLEINEEDSCFSTQYVIYKGLKFS
jgi:anaerobic ribonucleoside-triphosphate reductase